MQNLVTTAAVDFFTCPKSLGVELDHRQAAHRYTPDRRSRWILGPNKYFDAVSVGFFSEPPGHKPLEKNVRHKSHYRRITHGVISLQARSFERSIASFGAKKGGDRDYPWHTLQS